MKCCKVYCTYFGKRRGRITSSPSNAEEAYTVFRNNLENDMTFEHGVDAMDIIIVNNYSSKITGECRAWLDEINNTEYRCGKILVFDRENTGVSMGAYSHAFDLLEDEYAYWLFIEDDLRIIYPGYYKMIIDEFSDTTENLGFLALTLINNLNDRSRTYVSGGFGAARREVLKEVKKAYGRLPYDEVGNPATYAGIGSSEVIFTNCYYRMGYKVRTPNNSDFITLADNWQNFPPNVKWQGIMNFDLSKKFFIHVGL